MKILLPIILAFLTVSPKNKYEFEIVRTNDNQDVLWSIELVEDESGEIIHQTDLSNDILKPKQKIEVDQSGKYFFKFKSKFGDSIVKETSTKKRKQKIKFPELYYQEIDFDKIKNRLINENQFQVLHFNFGCWGTTKEIWTFNNEKKKLSVRQIGYDDENIKLSKSEYSKFVKALSNVKRTDKNIGKSTYRDLFYLKINNQISIIEGEEFDWLGFYTWRSKIDN